MEPKFILNSESKILVLLNLEAAFFTMLLVKNTWIPGAQIQGKYSTGLGKNSNLNFFSHDGSLN